MLNVSRKIAVSAFALFAWAGLAGNTALAAKPGWLENFETAKKQAAAEKKHVLLDFTGSDWCSWCLKIDKEIFAKPDFKEFSAAHLVLLELDFPTGREQPAELKTQNQALQRQFKVEGYPTLVLLDPAGKEVTRWVGFKPTLLQEIRKITGNK
jgi:protein disulfide-isomerase